MVDLTIPIRGRAWKFGDSIDTNQLAGGGIRGTSGSETLRINCLRGLRPEFSSQVAKGDLLIAGSNFGCGSSRESAVEALQLCGIAAVLAESVARIHRRNSIALGLPTFEVPGITDLIADGDIIEVSYPDRTIINSTSGKHLKFTPFSSGVEEIYAEGGMLPVIRARLIREGFQPTGS